VLDAPEVPGGIFVHFSVIEMEGFKTLRDVQSVEIDLEAPLSFDQDGTATGRRERARSTDSQIAAAGSGRVLEPSPSRPLLTRNLRSHNPEVAGSNPAPATGKAPETGLFRSLGSDRGSELLPKFCLTCAARYGCEELCAGGSRRSYARRMSSANIGRAVLRVHLNVEGRFRHWPHPRLPLLAGKAWPPNGVRGSARDALREALAERSRD
jgi:hypothetical protein